MTRFRPGRAVGMAVGAFAILALGVYGPATLLGPLPPANTTRVDAPHTDAPLPPDLPEEGASAVLVAGSVEPVATAGSVDPLPMASAAKLVTALVVLDAQPLESGRSGPAVTITDEDHRDLLAYQAADARTVPVVPGESWSERDLLEAMILGSSNNHADTLARWAFGSLDGYLDAAETWLERNGLTDTRVADATGLGDGSTATATDLARLAALAATHPVVAEVLANPATALAGRRGVENTTAFLPEEGITGVSRSYTDAAGVCFLFSARVEVGEESVVFSGAFIRQPDYDTLAAGVTALMESARAGIGEHPVFTEGDPYVAVVTPWGDRAFAEVGVTKTRFGWTVPARVDVGIRVEDFATGRQGSAVGRVSTTVDGAEVSAPLVLDSTISDPGPGWRLLHPVPVISAWTAQGR